MLANIILCIIIASVSASIDGYGGSRPPGGRHPPAPKRPPGGTPPIAQTSLQNEIFSGLHSSGFGLTVPPGGRHPPAPPRPFSVGQVQQSPPPRPFAPIPKDPTKFSSPGSTFGGISNAISSLPSKPGFPPSGSAPGGISSAIPQRPPGGRHPPAPQRPSGLTPSQQSPPPRPFAPIPSDISSFPPPGSAPGGISSAVPQRPPGGRHPPAPQRPSGLESIQQSPPPRPFAPIPSDPSSVPPPGSAPGGISSAIPQRQPSDSGNIQQSPPPRPFAPIPSDPSRFPSPGSAPGGISSGIQRPPGGRHPPAPQRPFGFGNVQQSPPPRPFAPIPAIPSKFPLPGSAPGGISSSIPERPFGLRPSQQSPPPRPFAPIPSDPSSFPPPGSAPGGISSAIPTRPVRPSGFVNGQQSPPPRPFAPIPKGPSHSSSQTPIIPILVDERQGPNADGSYQFTFETGNGIRREEQGSPLNPSGAIAQEGQWSFTFPDGTPALFRFIADENGYRVESDLLPTPPPLPAHAIAQIEKARLEDNKVAASGNSRTYNTPSATSSRPALRPAQNGGYGRR